MAFVWLFFVLAWSVVWLRVLGSWGVAGPGVIARCWLLGMLWGPIALGTAQTWITSPAWLGFLDPVLLSIPVCFCLLWKRSYRCLSAADGFLMGFFLGFGYDWIEELFGIVFRGVARVNIPRCLHLIPPTILSWESSFKDHHYAQHGYWVALPSIVLCASLRFTPKGVAACLTVLAFVVSGLDRITWLALPAQPSTFMDHVFCYGLLVPWIALLALPVLSVIEARWVARGLGRKDRFFRIPLEWGAIFSALADRNCAAAMNVNERFRLFRQFNLVRRERIRHPGDDSLQRIEVIIARRQRQLPEPKDAPPLIRWSWKQQWPQAVAIATVLLLIFVVPFLSATAQQSVWTSLFSLPGYYGFHICLPALILLAFCAWVCFIFPTHLRAARDAVAPADPGVRYFVERWMWEICLAIVCILLFYRTEPGWGDFVSLSSPVIDQFNMDLYTSFSDVQWLVYLAAFMSLSGLAMLPTANAFRAERPREFRVQVLRRVVALACFLPWLIVAWKKDLAENLASLLNQHGLFSNSWQQLGSILAISLILLATRGTRWLVRLVVSRISSVAPLESSHKAKAS